MMNQAEIRGLARWARMAAMGDEQALEDLLAALYTPVLRFLMSRLRGHPDQQNLADDLVQETLLRVCGSVAQCQARTDAQVLCWVLKITGNATVDYMRSPSSRSPRRSSPPILIRTLSPRSRKIRRTSGLFTILHRSRSAV